MYLKEYIKQSERTMSDKGFSMNMLHVAWGLFTEVGELVDQAKKHIFYNKPLDVVNLKEELGDIMWYLAIIAREFNSEKQSILEDAVFDWLDGYNYMSTDDSKENLIDKLDELQTQLEYLRKECMALYRSQSTGYLEENLNTFIESFFNLIISLGLSFHDILETNINKLAKRYPDKFDSNLALNRDLKAEREVLEGLNTKTEQVDYIHAFIVSPSDYKQMQELGMIPKEKDNIDLKTIEGEGKGLFEYLKSEPNIQELHDKGLFVDNSKDDFMKDLHTDISKNLKKCIENNKAKDNTINTTLNYISLELEVDNSGIDSRVPKVVNDGM